MIIPLIVGLIVHAKECPSEVPYEGRWGYLPGPIQGPNGTRHRPFRVAVRGGPQAGVYFGIWGGPSGRSGRASRRRVASSPASQWILNETDDRSPGFVQLFFALLISAKITTSKGFQLVHLDVVE